MSTPDEPHGAPGQNDGYVSGEAPDDAPWPLPAGLHGPAIRDIGEHLPGLVRIAASTALHTTEWGVAGSARAARRIARAATHPGEAAELADEVGQAASVMADLARALSLGVPLREAVLNTAVSLGEVGRDDPMSFEERQQAPAASLRTRGEQLLERSRDVWNDDASHPAYERILADLAPDEARILVLLLRNGPQPTVDVRTGGPIGMVNSTLIAAGLNMIGARAGLRYVDQVPSCLNNLFRLGLIWLSRESMRDPLAYQVVEAQPDVIAALHAVKFAKVVRRSIHLTPFGEDFARRCFVSEEAADAPFPAHGTPSASSEPGAETPTPT